VGRANRKKSGRRKGANLPHLRAVNEYIPTVSSRGEVKLTNHYSGGNILRLTIEKRGGEKELGVIHLARPIKRILYSIN